MGSVQVNVGNMFDFHIVSTRNDLNFEEISWIVPPVITPIHLVTVFKSQDGDTLPSLLPVEKLSGEDETFVVSDGEFGKCASKAISLRLRLRREPSSEDDEKILSIGESKPNSGDNESKGDNELRHNVLKRLTTKSAESLQNPGETLCGAVIQISTPFELDLDWRRSTPSVCETLRSGRFRLGDWKEARKTRSQRKISELMTKTFSGQGGTE